MEPIKRADRLQWHKFLEHWGFTLTVAMVMVMARLFMFFSNLNGAPWICFFAGAFALMLCGTGLIARAKWPLYRAGRFFTFGVNSMPAQLRRTYKWGWRLFLAGAALGLCLLLSRQGALR